MNFKKLFLTAIFAITLTSCQVENEVNNEDDKIYSVYKLYRNNGGNSSYEEWLESIKGETGQDGVSVVSIEKTSSNGLVDTYTISYSDGTTSNFDITNGAQGPQGEQGSAGSSFLKGTENPDDSIGKDGDTYLNISTSEYFTKVAGAWVKLSLIDDKVTLTINNEIDLEQYTFEFERGDQAFNNDDLCELYGNYRTVFDKTGYDIIGFSFEGCSAIQSIDYLPFISMTKDRTITIRYEVITAAVNLICYSGCLDVNNQDLENLNFYHLGSTIYRKYQTYFDEKIVLPELTTNLPLGDDTYLGWALNNHPISEYSFDGYSDRNVFINTLYLRIFPTDLNYKTINNTTVKVGSSMPITAGFNIAYRTLNGNVLNTTVHKENYAFSVSSSNEKVATYADGSINAVGEGKSIISVYNEEFNISSSFEITVYENIESFEFDKTELTIGRDGEFQVQYTITPSIAKNVKITWNSSNTNAATVENGYVKAKAAGTTTITATVTDDPSIIASLTLKVLSWTQGAVDGFNKHINGYYPKYNASSPMALTSEFTDDYGRSGIQIVGSLLTTTLISNYSTTLTNDGFTVINNSNNKYSYLEKEVTKDDETFTVAAHIGQFDHSNNKKYGVRFYQPVFNNMNDAFRCLKDGIYADSKIDVVMPSDSFNGIKEVKENKINGSLNCGSLNIKFEEGLFVDFGVKLIHCGWSLENSDGLTETYKFGETTCLITLTKDVDINSCIITYK